MALRKKNISIDLTSGVNTKIDDKISNQPTEMENVYIDKDAVLRKMNGFAAIVNDVYENETTGDYIASGESLDYPLDLISNKGDSVVMDSKGLYGLNLNDNLVKKSGMVSYGATNKVRAVLGQIEPYQVNMAETTKAYHVLSSIPQVTLVSYEIIQKNGIRTDAPGLTHPAVLISSGDEVYSVARSTGTPNNIFLGKQNDDGDNPTSLTTLFNVGVSTRTMVDVAEYGANLIAVATGLTDIFVAIVQKDGTILSQTSFTKNHIKDSAISVSTDGDEISILYSADENNPNAETVVRRLLLTSALAETSDVELYAYDNTTICKTANVTGIYLGGSFYWATSSTNPNHFETWAGIGPTQKWSSIGLSIASKLVVKNGEIFFYGIDYTTGINGARTNPPIAGTFPAKNDAIEWMYKLYKIPILSATSIGLIEVGKLSEIIGTAIKVDDVNYTLIAPIEVVNMQLSDITGAFGFMSGSKSNELKNIFNLNEVNFNARESEPFIEYGSSSLIFGSQNFIYDGEDAFKIAPDFYPSHYHYTVAAGSLTGNYDFKAVITYFDNRGNIYRSRPSNKLSITLAAQDPTISYHIEPAFAVGASGYKLELYQKLTVDEVYKKVGEAISGSFPGVEGGVKVTYEKDYGINLYSTGGVLENDSPLSARASVFHNGRVFYLNALRDNILGFSKKYVVGESVQFSSFQEVVIEDNQGRRAEKSECLASLDSKLIIFKPNSILAIYGEGPDATGGNNDFSEPELVTTDVGCSNQRSIILTSKGVMFQSAKGIYLLSRNMAVDFVGAEVEEFNSPVVQADLMEDENQVRFILEDGKVLVYNYFFEKWTHWTLSGAVSSLLSNRGWHYLLSTGVMKIQDNASFRDDGNFIARRFDTGWLKFNGVQGFQRIWRLIIIGDYVDAHQLRITAEYNYNTGGGDVYLITPDALLDYQYEIHLKRQKCQAVRFIIEDVDTGVTEEGCQISNITIMAGVKKGFNKISSSKKG